MEKPISRRHFLLLSSLLTVSFPYRHAFAAAALQKDTDPKTLYSVTIEVLREAYISEMTANKHYIGFCQKALDEKYPNIAYIFLAFSKSEKIHADNYERILGSLESRPDAPFIRLLILDTKANLRNAAEKE